MPEFEVAHRFVEKWEGLESNDPVDRGGHTYLGISRKAHPNWAGWPLVDASAPVDTIRPLAKRLYRTQYWHPLWASQYPSQRLATIVYQAAVNCGVRVASRWLQRSLNEHHPIPLKVDGRVGNHTLKSAYDCKDAGVLALVEDAVLDWQLKHYELLADEDASQRRFLSGWRNRVDALRKG